MDALALLCNLHADGPTTLEELHRIGVRGLGDVLRQAAGVLVDELGWNASAAERFVREAGHLSSRLGETLLDPEEESESVTGAAFLSGEVIGAVSLGESFEAAPRAAARGGVDAVLRQWRNLDEHEPVARATPAAPARRERRALPPDVAAALEPGSLERLREMGLDDLQELIRADPLELARGLRTGFSRALRLQFLAKRAAADAAEFESDADSEAPGAHRAPEATVAGPFA